MNRTLLDHLRHTLQMAIYGLALIGASVVTADLLERGWAQWLAVWPFAVVIVHGLCYLYCTWLKVRADIRKELAL